MYWAIPAPGVILQMPHTETLTAAALVVWSSLSKKRAPERAHGKAGKGGCLDQEVFFPR